MQRFIDWWQGPGAWAGLKPEAREAFLRVGRKVYQEVRSLTADRTPHGAYAGIEAPALVMTAQRSPLAARRVVETLAEAFPRATLVRFDDAGHMAPLTHGHAVNEAILEHLASSASPDRQ